MQNQYLQHGTTTPSVTLKFINPATGLDRTDLTHATAGLTIAYARPGAAAVSIALVTQTATGAYASGGFVHKGGGVYRLDPPVAAVATGAAHLEVMATALPADTVMISIIVALGPDDLQAASDTKETISTQVIGDLAGAPGATARTAIGAAAETALADNIAAVVGQTETALADNIATVGAAVAAVAATVGALPDAVDIAEETALTVAGVRDLKFDEASDVLTVRRKTGDTVVGTAPVRRGDRAQPVTGNG